MQIPASTTLEARPARIFPRPGGVRFCTVLGRSELRYALYVPGRVGPESPCLVSIHGISRNAREHARRFASYAEPLGAVVVAPLFGRTHFPGYQRLGRGLRAVEGLDCILDDVARRTGVRTQRLHLFGHSGGGQFVHRYVMFHPQRIVRAAVSAAGWYTFPDPALPYPYGLRGAARVWGRPVEPWRLLRVPVAVFVGERDTTQQALRREPALDLQQGTDRIQRGRAWTRAMARAAGRLGLATPFPFELLPQAGHDFGEAVDRGGLVRRAMAFLFDGNEGVS